jgi:acyl-CoA synthetase (AMP-forming)/AMP-acid ligase II
MGRRRLRRRRRSRKVQRRLAADRRHRRNRSARLRPPHRPRKDLIKSGGEWISSVELESQLAGHLSVHEATVIAMPDERWTERPLACVVLEQSQEAQPGELQAHLSSSFARWRLPDAFTFVAEIPKTSVAKFDKKLLRRQLAAGELDVRRPEAVRS